MRNSLTRRFKLPHCHSLMNMLPFDCQNDHLPHLHYQYNFIKNTSAGLPKLCLEDADQNILNPVPSLNLQNLSINIASLSFNISLKIFSDFIESLFK